MLLDLVLAALIGVTASLVASRAREGAFLALGATLALGPLLRLNHVSPLLAVLATVVLGAGLVYGARVVRSTRRGRDPIGRTAGFAAGALLGLVVVLTLSTALPIERSALDPNQVDYPPRIVTTFAGGMVQSSWFLQAGRDILFAPLLATSSDTLVLPKPVASRLHDWLIIGEPWA